LWSTGCGRAAITVTVTAIIIIIIIILGRVGRVGVLHFSFFFPLLEKY
jgi:hypothetical protein